MALNVTFDNKSLLINGKRTFIISGAFHYFRLPHRSLWKDRFKKMKECGLNAADIYFPWHYHSPEEGQYDFSGPRDVDAVMDEAEAAGLYLICRAGPYCCAEIDAGGFPGWLLTTKDVILRCRKDGQFVYSEKYLHYVRQWYSHILPKIAKRENLILFQIENEYNPLPYSKGLVGFITNLFRAINPRPLFDVMAHPLFRKQVAGYARNMQKQWPQGIANNPYMKELYKMAREFGIKAPIFHNDIVSFGPRQMDVDMLAIDDYSIVGFKGNWRKSPDAFSTMDIMEEGLRSSKKTSPLFVAEMQGGWYDLWGGPGYEKMREALGVDQLDICTKTALSQGAALFNWYMFCGGTSWGYLGSPDVYSSYDMAAPVSESGVCTERFEAAKLLCDFIKIHEKDLTEAEPSEEISSSNKKLYFKCRKSKNKTFVFLRNLTGADQKTILSVSGREIEVSLEEAEMKISVLSSEGKVLSECWALRGQVGKEKKHPQKVLELSKFSFSHACPQDVTAWKKIPEGSSMDMDSLGVHHGFIWYAGIFEGHIPRFSIDARHCYTVYLNGKLLYSYDNFPNVLATGKDFARKRAFEIPENLCRKGENHLLILVESLGHNKDFEEDAGNPRGIVSIKTYAPVSWRYRGGLLEGESGLCPVLDISSFKKKGAKKVKLPHVWQEGLDGVGIYETTFTLPPDLNDKSAGLVIDKAISKANIYLNGSLMGRYWHAWGPQKKFYLPEGILKEGENHLAIALWKRENAAELQPLWIETYE